MECSKSHAGGVQFSTISTEQKMFSDILSRGLSAQTLKGEDNYSPNFISFWHHTEA